MAELTFYPDADTESTSVDGRVQHRDVSSPQLWASIRDGAGNSANDVDVADMVHIASASSDDFWATITRGIILFDTSAIPDRATIDSATLSLYGHVKDDTLVILPNINIYSSNPASNTGLVSADFTTLGMVAYCDTPITYGNWSITGYNAFVLNATGLAAISKTSVTKFGVRNANYDAANAEPSNATAGKLAQIKWKSADEGGDTRPKLVITFTPAIPTVTTDTATNIQSTTATLNGDITDTGGEDCSDRGFEWATSPFSITDNAWTESGTYSVGTFSRGVTGLDADTTYYYRAKALNSAGWGYGSIKTLQGASVYPTEALSRVTGLVHRWSAGPNPVYQLEIISGGLSSQYFSPISAMNEPEPTIPMERETPVWRPTLLDYGRWLAARTHEEQVAIFGEEAVSFADWSQWIIGQRAMGREF